MFLAEPFLLLTFIGYSFFSAYKNVACADSRKCGLMRKMESLQFHYLKIAFVLFLHENGIRRIGMAFTLALISSLCIIYIFRTVPLLYWLLLLLLSLNFNE